MFTGRLPDPDQVIRRGQLRTLDLILADLETLNLRQLSGIPAPLVDRLRGAGVGYRQGAPASEIIDSVFRAQEPYLQPLPGAPTLRRPAA